MQTVEYSQWLPYDVHEIFDFLTDPAALAAVVGRILSAKVIERQQGVELLELKLKQAGSAHGQ